MQEELKRIEKGKLFCEYLVQLGVEYAWCIRHKKVMGCSESERYYERFLSYIGEDYCIGKNLLLQERKGEKRIFLLVVPSDKQVDLKDFGRRMETRKLEFVSSEKMEEVLHTEPGNVSVFHLLYDREKQVHLVLDEELCKYSLLAFHPLYNGLSVFLKPEELFKFLDYFQIEYRVDSITGKTYQKCLS